jgi:hypothetical protein
MMERMTTSKENEKGRLNSSFNFQISKSQCQMSKPI